MFPDRASLYVVAIEDRQYKDFKIHCECCVLPESWIVATYMRCTCARCGSSVDRHRQHHQHTHILLSEVWVHTQLFQLCK